MDGELGADSVIGGRLVWLVHVQEFSPGRHFHKSMSSIPQEYVINSKPDFGFVALGVVAKVVGNAI